MPLYGFECPRCGERFEELVHTGARSACPRCGEEETRRLFSPVSAAHKFHIDRGLARDSDARRAERETRRYKRFREERKRRRGEGGGSSGGSS
jgi:putative FmdB family regulatory protein